MAGEMTVVHGTPKTLEANGSSIANNAVGTADDADYSIASDGGGYPDAEFVLVFAFGTAPTENAALALYARPLNLDGTTDAEVPEIARPTELIGVVPVNNVTTTQVARIIGRDLPREATYYVGNVTTGQTVSAGWKLTVTPRSYAPAA